MLERLTAEIKSIGDFSDSDIKILVSALEKTTIAKGEYFLEAGEVSRRIGYITRGLVMYYMVNDGNEIPCDFAIESDWVTYLKSLATGTRSDMYIKALEDTDMLILTAPQMEQLFSKQPKFMALKNYYTELSFIRNTQHTANLASLNAKDRYYKLMKDQPELIRRVPQYYIAAYLGIKPQSLSRLRK